MTTAQETILKGSDLTLENIAAECKNGRRYATVTKKERVLHVHFYLDKDGLSWKVLGIRLPFEKKDLDKIIKIKFQPIIYVVGRKN